MAMRTAVLTAVLALACTVGQKKTAVETAVDDDARRRETFEATLRVLDEKPEYVDEFFQLAREHDRTLNRFVADFSRALEDPALARTTAYHLVRAPDGLHQILIATLDAADGPRSMKAITTAMAARSEKSAAVMANDPSSAAELAKAFGELQGRKVGEALRRAVTPDEGTGSGGTGKEP